jgi:hypothetical protein
MRFARDLHVYYVIHTKILHGIHIRVVRHSNFVHTGNGVSVFAYTGLYREARDLQQFLPALRGGAEA